MSSLNQPHSTFISHLVQGSLANHTTQNQGSGKPTSGGTLDLEEEESFTFTDRRENAPSTLFADDSHSTLLGQGAQKKVTYNAPTADRNWNGERPGKKKYLDAIDNDRDDLESIVDKSSIVQHGESQGDEVDCEGDSEEEDYCDNEEKKSELDIERRNARVRGEQTAAGQFKLRMPIAGSEFNEYAEMLIENGKKNVPKTHLCLTCWTFISLSQRLTHRRIGHNILDNYMLTSKSQLIDIANTQG